MRGIKLNDIHTANDWELILNSKKIDPPTPKIVKVSIDGRTGDLDLSEALTGDIEYENRELTCTFLLCEGTHDERERRLTEIINTVHGRTKKIVLPDDPFYYFLGRCAISDVTNTRAYASFVLTADCEAFKYALTEVNRVITATSTVTDVILTNTGRRTLIPTVTVTGTVNLVIGSTSVSLSAGSYQLTALQLKTGSNAVSISGSGTVTFTYREAVL